MLLLETEHTLDYREQKQRGSSMTKPLLSATMDSYLLEVELQGACPQEYGQKVYLHVANVSGLINNRQQKSEILRSCLYQ